MASTNQQIIANLYQVFGTDTAGNITTIGISNVSTGNITANGRVTLGAIGNVKVTGGTSGQLLTTDGAGNLSFVTVSASTGNIASLNLNGNGQQVLAGNGAWVPQTASANYGNIVNTNYSGNGQQVLAGNGVWVGRTTGNIANTNYTGNAQQYLNGAGQWTGIPGINVGNVAYANFNGNAAQVLSGANTWVSVGSGNVGNIGNVAYANFTGNTGQVLTGANTWTTITGTITYPSPANSALFLNGAGGWSVPASGNGGGITYPGNTSQWLRGDGTWANIAIPTYGNVANLNLNGNTLQVLNGAGQWIAMTGGSGSNVPNLNGNGNTVLAGNGNWRAIGNVSGLNLNGNTFTYLNGGGQWANIVVPVTGTVAPLNLSGNVNQVLSGTGAWVPATSSGNVGQLNLNGNANTVLSGTGSWRAVGNVSASNYNGNGSTILSGNGAWVSLPAQVSPGGSNSWIQYNAGGAFGANSLFTYDAANSTMIAANANIGMLKSLKTASENVTIVSVSPVGTYNIQLLTSSVTYIISPMTTGITLNLVASGLTTLNSVLSSGQSITTTFISIYNVAMNVPPITSVQIDGVTQTVKWLNGATTSVLPSSTLAFTFSVVKTSNTPTYTILGSSARYV
jgi:hypothetical protein